MGEQISNPTFAKPTLDKLSKSMSNVKVKHSDSHSRSNFKVHKFLLSFAIPLDQFSDLPLNRDHTIHVSVIIVNPALKIPLLGPRGIVPTGSVILGIDKTLLKGVARVVKECTGLKLDAIKSHLGAYRHDSPSSIFPTLGPTSDKAVTTGPTRDSGPSSSIPDPPSSGLKDGKDGKAKSGGGKAMVYSFLATVDSESKIDPSPNVQPESGFSPEKEKRVIQGDWKWCSKTEIEGMNLSSDHRKRLLAVLGLVENATTGVRLRIPPTRLIVPKFEVVKSLKAYLLPLGVFRALPPLGGKELIASVAVVHPTEKKILLVQRSPTDSWANHWEFPGGRSESKDLTILHTAVREVKEETGLEVGRFKALAGTFEVEKQGVAKARVYVFLAKLGPSQYRATSSSAHRNHQEGEVSRTTDGGGSGKGGRMRGETTVEDVVEVRLNPEEHQAYKWVGNRGEVEELKVPLGLKPVMMDLLDALNHTASSGQE